MVIFETWPAGRGAIPVDVGNELARIADRSDWNDHMRVDLERARTREPAAGFVAVWARESTAADPSVLGLGQLSAGNGVDLMEIGVADTVSVSPDGGAAVLTEIFDATVDAQRVYHPDTDVVLWTSTTPGEQAVAERARQRGFVTQRVLLQMRRPLPAPQPELTTRGFDPARDVDAWLSINNAAFAGHSEQGGWTAETFEQRRAQPWFDPDGLRLAEIDGTVAGFCWVKMHHAGDPGPGAPHRETPSETGGETQGEIYVIAVDPAFAGQGLGTQLVLAGLQWMVDHGAAEALLYTDADNIAAVTVYERLGFRTASERTALLSSADAVAKR